MPNVSASTTDLVAQFATAVAAQTDAIWNGDAKLGNKHAKRYLSAFERLRKLGNSGRDALAVLFEHERPDVRVTAAAFLLRHRTEEAMAVLRVAAGGEGLVSFEAQQALQRWAEGSWSLDPE